MKRRALLSLGVTALAGGCLDGGRPRPRPRIAWIWLRNDRDEPNDVTVVVRESGDAVFAETYRLGTTPDTASVNVEEPVDEPGDYVVRATVDGETREVNVADHVDGDENCVGVRVTLLDNGGVDYWTKSMQQC
ncbi:hypothetical protein [Haloparvum sp. PAK95]|uniref:hypothetical protein n=1 Tax=Haloparvum sp. PAK95 TaxID=3418962 RepID=UPI003D2E9DC9